MGLPHLEASPPAPLLIVGDSHTVGTFGRELDQVLRERVGENAVATYGSCGSAPSHWASGSPTQCGYFFRGTEGRAARGTRAPTPIFTEKLRALRPRGVVIALGANLMGVSLEASARSISLMLAPLREASLPCVWVGPPDGRNKTEPKFSQLYEVIERETHGVCRLIDSRKLTDYPARGGDGAHYDSLGESGRIVARAWAREVGRQVLEEFRLGPGNGSQ